MKNSPLYYKSGGTSCPSSPMRIVLPVLKGIQKGYQGIKGLSKTKKYVAGATAGTAVEYGTGSKLLDAADDWFLFGAGKALNKLRSGGYRPGGGATITPYNESDEKNSKEANLTTRKPICNDNKCIR